MPDDSRPMQICSLCDDWPGSLFDMSRPCCVARWLKRQPPHVDRKQYLRELTETKGREFVQSVHAFWGSVE